MNAVRWRLIMACFFLALLSCLAAGRLSAATTDARYQVGLGAVAMDGGLRYSLVLGIVKFDESFSARLFLEHELVDLGYGEAQSRLLTRPLITSLTQATKQKLMWRTLGGEEIVFPAPRPALPDKSEISPLLAEALGEPLRDCLVSINATAQLISDPTSSTYYIVEGRFLWCYRSGALAWIRTPAGNSIEVRSVGARITAMQLGSQRCLAASWNAAGQPVRISWGNEVIDYSYDSTGELREVADSGKKLHAAFTYDAHGLISSVQSGTGSPQAITWTRPDQSFSQSAMRPKPFVLSQMGAQTYRLNCNEDTITVEATDPAAGTRRLRLNVMGGAVRWISED